MSWSAQWVGCAGGIVEGRRTVPSHPLVTAGDSSKIRCLICSYAEEVSELQRRIDRASELLHEGKVVQAHEMLRRGSGDLAEQVADHLLFTLPKGEESEEAPSSSAWEPLKGDRVRLVRKIACTAPVGSEGEITMLWEPSTSNEISRPAQFCVDCEGWPPFVTDASNLELVKAKTSV